MEKRKIVKSGLFSYTVALPKEWVLRHKLEKGSTVFIDEDERGLVLSPSKHRKSRNPESKEIVLNVDKARRNSVTRDIVAAYLTNITSIKLEGKTLKESAQHFKKTISMLAGLEVIEETSNSILVKDFINVDELNVPELLRRSDNIVRSLFSDTLDCLGSLDYELAETIRLRDKEINRITFLVSKCLNYVSQHPQEGKIHGVRPVFSNYIWELNGYLEKMGDEIKRFALAIPSSNLIKKEGETIREIFLEIEKMYVAVMTALYKHDISAGDKASHEREKILEKCNDYLSKSKSFPGRNMIRRTMYMIAFIHNISRIIRYIKFENHSISEGDVLLSKDS